MAADVMGEKREPRAIRDAAPIEAQPMKSKERIHADFAAAIGMTAEALRRNPMPGLTLLFEHFSPAASRHADRIFSVHPVRLGESGFEEWHTLFGIAAAEDDAGRRRALAQLQTAIQELALDLFRPRRKSRHHLRNLCYRVYRDNLRQRKALIDARAAMAAALAKGVRRPPLRTALARWMAQLALAKYEPALGRLDAPDMLELGSADYAHRHLAIINRTPNHPSHWLMSERALLGNSPPPNAALGEIEFTALQFAYAQHREYLQAALANPAAKVDPAIAEHAVEDLRRSLRSAGVAGRLVPPGADGIEALPADWIERIDWMAFNGAHFLSERGARAPYRNTFTWWLLAIRDCFQPAAGLEIAQMDVHALNLFVDRLSDSQAFGANHAGAWDEGFVKNLFDAFLRHHVAPLAAAPFERALYRATAPLQFLRCDNPNVAPGVPSILRSMEEVKEGLRRELFARDAPGVSGADRHLSKGEQRLIVECLCAMYAPALTLEHMPGEMAYGTYAGPNGECMGMLDFPDASYKFKGSWINELKPGEVVTLKRVRGDDPDPILFEQYRRINTNVRQDPDMFLPGSLYQLRDATPVMKLRFDMILRATDRMLAGAQNALRNPTRDVKRLLLSLLPETWKGQDKRRFVDALENGVARMIDALRIVKHNKYDVIGFGTAKRSLEGSGEHTSLTFARAEALSGAFVGKMNEFPLIKHAVIYFDIRHFLTAGEEALMQDLAHELSHACLDTRDTISEKSTAPVYSRQSVADRNEISIDALRAAWAEPDSDPAMHAATIEVFVKLLSMAEDPARRPGLADILAGGNIFRLSAEAAGAT